MVQPGEILDQPVQELHCLLKMELWYQIFGNNSIGFILFIFKM
jgi:hypothetical protein